MSNNQTIKHILGLISWLSLSFATAIIGAIASANAGVFYQQLARPAWAPPAWLFAPAWSLLYLLMALAAWLVWKARGFQGASSALKMYLLQLLVNALWSWLFFAWHQGALAFLEILLLWALILATLVAFWRILPLAGILLLPYLAWVSFAAILCFSIWQLNPRLLA
jgi:tryptophan-rich sensory protein